MSDKETDKAASASGLPSESGKEGMSNGKKAGIGALGVMIVTLLITILSQIDGEAVGKKVNNWILSGPSVEASVEAELSEESEVSPKLSRDERRTSVGNSKEGLARDGQSSKSSDAKSTSTDKEGPPLADWLAAAQNKLRGLELIVNTLTGSDEEKSKKLDQIRGELDGLRIILDRLDEGFKSSKQEWQDFLKDYYSNEREVTGVLAQLRERLSFLEGKIDILTKGR